MTPGEQHTSSCNGRELITVYRRDAYGRLVTHVIGYVVTQTGLLDQTAEPVCTQMNIGATNPVEAEPDNRATRRRQKRPQHLSPYGPQKRR